MLGLLFVFRAHYDASNVMGQMSAVREIWRPETEADSEAVLRELKKVLASPQFCNSKRYPALLGYVVEETLAGRADDLKERTLGVEVFGRPATYDTSLDTVVRYTAGEIRKRLSLYYHEEGRDARIQVHLPVGSYVPEFVCLAPEPSSPEPSVATVHEPSAPIADQPSAAATSLHLDDDPSVLSPADTQQDVAAAHRVNHWQLWTVLAILLLSAIAGGVAVNARLAHQSTAVDDFWEPLVRGSGPTLLCVGGVVFQQNNYSGVITAGKNTDYPFVSMQIAASLPRVSQVLVHENGDYEVQSSASTPITQMRNRPVVLLGGYNNEWTMRLLHPLRYQFSPEPVESIVDSQKPGIAWSRDKSQPYSTGDDYALVARFRDATTDGNVVVLAGLGRNGSEAAAQFATSPHYMGLVRDRVGADLKKNNIEVVLKTDVIDGKTGAPAIVAVYTW